MAFIDLSGRVQPKMRELREKGELTPVRFGFHTWNQYDQGKFLMGSRKCTLLLGGEPNHGKSQITKELVLQMVEKHKFKVALFCTEDGDVEKLFSIYCGMYIGKSYTKIRPDGKVNAFAMTDDEASEAEYFLLNHLYIFKQDRKDTKYQTLDNIYTQIAKAEDFYNIKFDSLVIDPIYDVDDFKPDANEVLRVLNRINLEAEENNRFDIIVNHVSETAKMMDKNGNRKKLLALADEFYGGKNNNRKAMLQVLVHRPMKNDGDDGNPVVLENQTNLHILKVKPEGIAKWGIYDIYFDWKSRRYYEMFDENGIFKKQFASCSKMFDKPPDQEIDIKKITASPQEAFNTENDDEYEDCPF